jgi:hypothetical protein
MKLEKCAALLMVFVFSIFGCGGSTASGDGADPVDVSDSCEDYCAQLVNCGDLEFFNIDNCTDFCDELDGAEGDVIECDRAAVEFFECINTATCDDLDDEATCIGERDSFFDECEILGEADV